MPEDELTMEEETGLEELEFLEIDELFDESEAELCNNCRWRNFTSEDGKQKSCSLITMINRLAARRGVEPLDNSFGCNRWTETKQEEEVIV